MPVYRDGLGDETGRVIRDDLSWLEYRYAPAGTCEMVHLFVDPDLRRQGIGRSLVAKLEADPKVRILYGFTEADNSTAQKFYRALGFTLQPVRDFYGYGRDALLFHKVLR